MRGLILLCNTIYTQDWLRWLFVMKMIIMQIMIGGAKTFPSQTYPIMYIRSTGILTFCYERHERSRCSAHVYTDRQTDREAAATHTYVANGGRDGWTERENSGAAAGTTMG